MAGYDGADRFAQEILAAVEENAIIYADGTTVYPLLLTQQIEGIQPNVTIVSSHGTANNLAEYDEDVIDSLLAKRPVYVVSPVKGYCPAFLLDRSDFVKQGLLYRVIKKGKKLQRE